MAAPTRTGPALPSAPPAMVRQVDECPEGDHPAGLRLELGDITVDVVLKDIQNVHLSVHPPDGRVRLAAPFSTSLESLRLYAIARLGWIKARQRRLQAQERETPRDYVDRESHQVWGRRYLLQVEEAAAAPRVRIHGGRLQLRVRPGADTQHRAAAVAAWYRQLLKVAVPPLVATWEPRLGVTVKCFFVQHMRTRWGSCNPGAGTIRLNTELAKKPKACLEYIVVHEMAHLVEPTHGPRFIALMDAQLPGWRERRALLNGLPLRHEGWEGMG